MPVLLLVSAFSGAVAQAPAPQPQTTPAQMALTDSLTAIQPLLAQINLAVSAVDVRRWKAPGDTKETTAADVVSIQKDLNTTLPGLISRAQSTPAAISPSFAVFRNIDALYDVLLRVTETATLAGSQAEADRLEEVRAQLQARRAQLGNAILASSAAEDNDVAQLRAARAAVPAVTPSSTGPTKIIVNDGPDAPVKPARKKKPVTPPATSQPPSTQP